jgi:hypothetical protein
VEAALDFDETMFRNCVTGAAVHKHFIDGAKVGLSMCHGCQGLVLWCLKGPPQVSENENERGRLAQGLGDVDIGEFKFEVRTPHQGPSLMLLVGKYEAAIRDSRSSISLMGLFATVEGALGDCHLCWLRT